MQKNSRVFAYVRSANPKSNTNNQIEKIKDYCSKNSLTLSDLYEETSSGLIPFNARPVGSKLYSDCLAGLIDVIIIVNYERIGRNINIIDDFLKFTKNTGVKVISLSPQKQIKSCFSDELMQYAKHIKSQLKSNERECL